MVPLAPEARQQYLAARHAQSMRAQEVEPLTAHADQTVGELGAHARLDVIGK